MAAAYRASGGAALDERLMRALEAGDAAGGDRRGRHRPAFGCRATRTIAPVDLRVDEHAQPVTELRRVLEIARLQLVPFVEGMPRRGIAAGPAPEGVTSMQALAPPDRPGGGGSRPA